MRTFFTYGAERPGMHTFTPSCSWNGPVFTYYFRRNFRDAIDSMPAVGGSCRNARTHKISLWRGNLRPWQWSVFRGMKCRFLCCRSLLATIKLWPRWRINRKRPGDIGVIHYVLKRDAVCAEIVKQNVRHKRLMPIRDCRTREHASDVCTVCTSARIKLSRSLV